MTADEIFHGVLASLSGNGLSKKEAIIDIASRMLYKTDSPLTLFRGPGELGVCGQILYREVNSAIGQPWPEDLYLSREEKMAVVKRLLEHFKIPVDFVPPIPLIRQALALMAEAVKYGNAAGIATLSDRMRATAVCFSDAEAVLSLPYENFVEMVKSGDLLDGNRLKI
jgi:hypothetical protein